MGQTATTHATTVIPMCVPLEAALGRHEPADPTVDVAEEALGRVASLEVRRAIRRLHPLERRLVCLRYGLCGEPAMSLADAGARVGLSAAGALGVERRALARLREMYDGGERR